MTKYRTHLNLETIDVFDREEKVQLSGWINSIRDHGGVYFIDLRDESGLVQLVANPSLMSDDEYDKFHSLRDEFVITIEGEIRDREDGLENPNLETGSIEIIIDTLEILSTAKTLPFQPGDESVNGDLRLKYRYLDLRDPKMKSNLVKRSQALSHLRSIFLVNDYTEIETPLLLKTSEGGAEEVYATSKLFPGNFYSLPQSPQMYKQLLMIGGIEKYYSVAKCFRAETARSDRSIEFTQIDLERAFVGSEEIISDATDLLFPILTMKKHFEEMNKDIMSMTEFLYYGCGINGDIDTDKKIMIPRITYEEAMQHFGSDKPDLRFKMPLIDVKKVFEHSGFEVFSKIAKDEKNVLKAIIAKNADEPTKLSKKKISALEKHVKQFGAKGLAYFQMKEEGLKGPLTKFLTVEDLKNIEKQCNLEVGDIIFFGAGPKLETLNYMGELRLEIANQLNLIDENKIAPIWITQFPMFEETSKGIKAMHHPFTAPTDESWHAFAKNEIDEMQLLTDSYDIVLNGVELGGGSVRIHEPLMQQKIFQLMKLTSEEIKNKFGFFTEALSYGTPPHAGLAMGLERIVMFITDSETIRDVIAFPKAQSAVCPMTDSPNELEKNDLKDLGFRNRSA